MRFYTLWTHALEKQVNKVNSAYLMFAGLFWVNWSNFVNTYLPRSLSISSLFSFLYKSFIEIVTNNNIITSSLPKQYNGQFSLSLFIMPSICSTILPGFLYLHNYFKYLVFHFLSPLCFSFLSFLWINLLFYLCISSLFFFGFILYFVQIFQVNACLSNFQYLFSICSF